MCKIVVIFTKFGYTVHEIHFTNVRQEEFSMSGTKPAVILRVARLYYEEGKSQQEIAETEHVHRTQVSRILKQAREEGYVKFTVAMPQSVPNMETARQLAGQLGLREVFITPELPHFEPEKSYVHSAANYLAGILPDYHSIGFGVGKTLSEIGKAFVGQRSDEVPELYGLFGYAGSDNPYLQGSVVLDQFARTTGGKCHYNNFPMLMDRNRLSPTEERQLETMRKTFRSLDLLVLSIGGPFSLDYPYFGEFYDTVRRFNNKKVFNKPHGNLLGNVLYADGKRLSLPEPYFNTSMSLEDLKRHPNVLCFAYGEEKVLAICAAAKGHYIDALVTDLPTAELLLQQSRC